MKTTLIRRNRGFTLIEVVIAMTIVAIAMVSLIEATGTYVKNTAFLRDKVIAHWVASNALNQLLLEQSYPDKGDQQGSETMAGKQWAWKGKVKETPNKAFRAVEVKVSKGDAQSSLATLVTYVSSALVLCEQANPQQVACQDWTVSGSTGNTNTANSSSNNNAN